MGFFNKIEQMRKKKFFDIKCLDVCDDMYYYTLIPLKVKHIFYDKLLNIKVIDEKKIPAFTEIYYSISLNNCLEGFAVVSVQDGSGWKALVDIDFIKNCCVRASAEVVLNSDISFRVFEHADIDTSYPELFVAMKVKLVSIFTVFEQEAIDAFKFGLIDVFTNMFYQINQCEYKRDVDDIILNVNEYMNDVYKTMVEMDALKEFSVKDPSLALNMEENQKEAERIVELTEKEKKKREKNNFISQIHARQELIRDFNKPLKV